MYNDIVTHTTGPSGSSPRASMSHDPEICNPGPTPGNSPDEMSTDSDEGIAQHIENLPLTSPTSSTNTDATATLTGRNKSNRSPLAPLPETPRSPRWPPYPYRPSDQERLIHNTTNSFVITITEDPDGDYYIQPLNEANAQSTIRPPHPSRDSGYDADESTNVTDNEPESESEGSEGDRLEIAGMKRKNKHKHESGRAQQQQDAIDTVTITDAAPVTAATVPATPIGGVDDDDDTLME